MLNQTGVTVTTVGGTVNFLEDVKVFFSLSCMVAADGVQAGEDGRKIIKAGTPLYGDLKSRSTAFTTSGSTAAGLLMYDVDVTAGDANAAVLVFGLVNVDKLDDDVKTAVLAAEDSLPLIKLMA